MKLMGLTWKKHACHNEIITTSYLVSICTSRYIDMIKSIDYDYEDEDRSNTINILINLQ